MKKTLFILLLLNLFSARASHIVGGDIYYDYLGNNNYTFYISMYRDCNSTGAAFDNPLNLAVYDANNFLVHNIQVPFTGSSVVPVVVTNPCVTSTPSNCTETTLYSTTVNLPPTVGGYNVTYQRCCRGPNITNLINPADAGFTLTCHVPGNAGNTHVNSSPRFSNYPPLVLCNNDDLVFDHSAIDPDGDQLVYSLVTPFTGASNVNPMPNPAPPPPYTDIVWAGGFTAATPLGPGSLTSIDANTGMLSVTPGLLGKFVVGVQVQEIRNGVVINQTVRDFLFQVFDCVITMQALLPAQDQLPTFVSYCDGLTIDFINNSFGGTNYAWDFGVPGISTDVSNAFEPTYTYPASGIYQAMLVVNPGWPCTDTAYMDINVNNEIVTSFTSNDSICFLDNSFDFVGSSSGPASTTYNWDFGPNGNPTTATGQTISNVNFNTTGFIPVTIEAVYNICVGTFTDSVFIYADPVAEIVLPLEVECAGLTIDFGNNSLESHIYSWDFGVPGTNTDVSTLEEPTFTFPAPGTYVVTLISGSSPFCSDTTTQSITLNEALHVAFTSEDSLCITGNSFNFDGTVSGPPNSVFTWNFGPNASIQSSNNIDEPSVSFTTTGSIPITLTGTFDDCIETVTHYIYLYQEPQINFGILDATQCAPFEAFFIDSSFAETGITYNWDFGDGTGSTEQNPTNIYYDAGQFNVTLTISTASGCVSTLSLMNPDLVDVHPRPEAGFSIDPNYTDICNSVVHFTDQSVAADSYFYWFDDSTSFSTESNPSHLYFTDGHHSPYQIVESEFGCRDTASQKLYIEPFTLYAPNSFTPDGDMFNNTFLPIAYLGVEEWKLEIYNRWGEVVFESRDPDFGWDGTTPVGTMTQTGTYLWKITFVSCEPKNTSEIITGLITLLK